MKINLLFVSIAFPPKNDPECIQTAKYFKYIQRQLSNIDVVTSKVPTLNMPFDEKLLNFCEEPRQIIEIGLKESRYINFIKSRFFKHQMEMPDAKSRFFKEWKSVIGQLNQKPDLIYTRSFPLSSAVMGLKLHKHYNVPWILHLSDPWVDSPLHHYTARGKNFNSNLEQECFEAAAKVSFTSNHTLDFYANKYPAFADKLVVFPNVYDPDDIKPVNGESKNRKLKIVYTGGLAGSRSPEPFLKALKMLSQDQRGKLEVIFAGQVDRKNKSILENYSEVGVNHLGLLSYSDAINLQQEANILLLLDSKIKDPKQAMFFPSKILDYMISGKPVLAVTDLDSSTYQVINNKYGQCFHHEEIESIKNWLASMIDRNESGKQLMPISAPDENYSALANASRLVNLFKSLI